MPTGSTGPFQVASMSFPAAALTKAAPASSRIFSSAKTCRGCSRSCMVMAGTQTRLGPTRPHCDRLLVSLHWQPGVTTTKKCSSLAILHDPSPGSAPSPQSSLLWQAASLSRLNGRLQHPRVRRLRRRFEGLHQVSMTLSQFAVTNSRT